MKVVIIPELGAKIWQITYKPRDMELLWLHPRLKARAIPFGSVYDDNFFGGWDELFPNDVPEEINGEQEPDHGELWTLPWNFRVEKEGATEVTLHLWVDTSIVSARMEKWITLRSGEPKLYFRHKLTNTGQVEFPYLWKLHLAMAVNEKTRIDMGAEKVYVEDVGPNRMSKTKFLYQWPFAHDAKGHEFDMRQALPSSSKINEFQYATKMKDGWCSVTHQDKKVGFGIAFDTSVFRSCWLFSSYGGWRNLNTVILEPCTGYPIRVSEGVRTGTHRTIAPGAIVECEAVGVVFEGLTGVEHIDMMGRITGAKV